MKGKYWKETKYSRFMGPSTSGTYVSGKGRETRKKTYEMRAKMLPKLIYNLQIQAAQRSSTTLKQNKIPTYVIVKWLKTKEKKS